MYIRLQTPFPSWVETSVIHIVEKSRINHPVTMKTGTVITHHLQQFYILVNQPTLARTIVDSRNKHRSRHLPDRDGCLFLQPMHNRISFTNHMPPLPLRIICVLHLNLLSHGPMRPNLPVGFSGQVLLMYRGQELINQSTI